MGPQPCTRLLPSSNSLQQQLLNKYYLKYKNQPYEYILQQFKHVQQIKTISQYKNKWIDFFQQLTKYYNAVPYHNVTHGFDVMIAYDKYLMQYNMMERLRLTEQERFYILIAAYAHDNGHQGYTNNFYINSQSSLAIRYSYQSPLENMHCSNLLQCFKRHNIFLKEQYKKLMIMLILATDNKHHNQMMKQIKLIQNSIIKNNYQIQDDKKQSVLKILIHTADINSCGKPLQIFLKWNHKLYEQFKQQFKQQRRLYLKQYSFDFDLNNIQFSIAKSNLGFFQYMVLPFFKQVTIIMPQFNTQYQYAIKNKFYFQQQKTKSDKKKSVIKLKKN